ncbi:hypothetical protein [Hyphomicrobium sp.]|uniref:hypothetical protein n=1 Tax=Hyphomicrobium sp. TaxID=82 RepID=UPI0025BD50E5|nr:hypothetical protein [Hyphomicrobium sp.]MCC7250929.1 hypothetical protein [Hyphomicrobium sp.]
MRRILIALALAVPMAAAAKERATFLAGQYATADQCQKLRKVEAGGPKNVGTSPELLDADGFHSWEGGCEFTKVFEHEPGQTWLTLMVCSEGMTVTPATYVFVKSEGEDRFEVHSSTDQDGPEVYTRCDARKGND